MAKAKPAVHWTNVPEEGAERTILQVSLPTSSQLQFVASLPKHVQVIPAPPVIDRGCDAAPQPELVDEPLPVNKNDEKVLKYREDEKVLKYKAHVIEEMFFRTSIDGMDRNILFLSNAQASVCTESAEHLQKLLDSFPMRRKPKMVINLCTSKGFGDHARACESFDQKLLPGLIEGKPPFCSARDESEAMERLDRFMSDVILPFAVETNALIFCSGISKMCALTSSLTRVVAACSQRWLRETPFTLIYTTPHLLQLYGSEHQWQGKEDRPSDPCGNEEMFWMKLKNQFEAAPSCPWKDRMHEFQDAYEKRRNCVEQPSLPKMWRGSTFCGKYRRSQYLAGGLQLGICRHACSVARCPQP